MNETITGYVPTSVSLSNMPELSDESKTKVCMIQDLVKIGKALGKGIPSPKAFDYLYDLTIPMLEAVVYNAQIQLNTKEYRDRCNGIL